MINPTAALVSYPCVMINVETLKKNDGVRFRNVYIWHFGVVCVAVYSWDYLGENGGSFSGVSSECS